MDILYSSWKFGIFFRFWYIVRRKIWQPCTPPSIIYINSGKAWPGRKRRFSRYNSKKCRLKTIFFKLCRIGPLPLGVVAPDLRKNLSTLIAKIVFSRNFNDFREKQKPHRFSPNFVGLTPAPRGRSSPICEKIQLQ
jgi:hypothetical protein